MSMFYTLIGLCLFGNTLAHQMRAGPCPAMTGMKDFDLKKYMGKWYSQKVLAIPNAPIRDKCQYEEYTLDSNGTVDDIYTSISRKDGSKTSKPRTWRITDPTDTAKIEFHGSRRNAVLTVYILETDYESFTLIYNCMNVREDHSIQSIVLTREQNPPESLMEKIDEVIEKHNFDKAGFRQAKQDDCVMKPEKGYTGKLDAA